MPLRKVKIDKLCLVISIISFFIGIFVANIKSLQYFVIDEKVDIVEVVSIIVTLIVAWYVGTILEKRNQGNRTKKKLILKRTEDVFKIIEDFIIKVNSGSILLQEAVAIFKRINVSVTRINKALSYVELPSDEGLNNKILDDLRALKDLLTNTPIASNNINPSLQVQNGIIMISQSRVLEIESKCDSLKQNVLFFQLFISNN